MLVGAVNVGGHLPKEIHAHHWFADHIYRAKCVIGNLFKFNKTNHEMTKLD